jgi:hypothetical protein
MRLLHYTTLFVFFLTIDLAIVFVTFTIPELQNVVSVTSGVNITAIYSTFEQKLGDISGENIPIIGDFWASVWLSLQLIGLTLVLFLKMPVLVSAIFGYFGIPTPLATIFLTLNTIVFMVTVVNVIRRMRPM